MCERSVILKLQPIKPSNFFFSALISCQLSLRVHTPLTHTHTHTPLTCSRPPVHVCRKSGMEYTIHEKELRDLCGVLFVQTRPFLLRWEERDGDAYGFH